MTMRSVPRPAPAAAAAALALLAAVLAPAPAAANPHLAACVDPASPLRTMAEACRRALDWGGLSRREQAAAWTNTGVALAEFDRHGDALAAYDRAARADAGFAPLYVNRAISRARRGRIDGALEDWTQAIRLSPRDWESRLARSGLLLQAGRAAEALADADAAVRLVPREGAAQHARARALQA
ncbi:MAG: tetratricopeptide repeat protein, partial [Pseudomonadota bacterium]